MIRFSLQLCSAAAPTLTASAWFVPGEQPTVWLDELARWDIPLACLTLYLLPRTLSDRTPAGVLAVPTEPLRPKVVVRAVAYGQRAGKLYVPVESRLLPEVTDQELMAALGERLYVLHPTIGLAGFERSDGRTVAALLRAPPRRAGQWDRAHPGWAPPARLQSVQLEQPLTVELLLDRGREDIGSQPLADLPPLPPTPTDASAGARTGLGQSIQRQLARLVQRLFPAAPAGAAGASGAAWFESLRSWAQRTLQDIGTSLTSLRQRELDRLLRLLESNPDEALRYALPLAQTDSSRGRASPTARLGPRDVNFNLGRLGRGRGPADPWEVGWETLQRLRQRYRELAERAAQLGRYRRAAYIYAELLEDYVAAAAVLATGTHFHEAAILYRDRLKRPLEAARCFQQAGLLHDAITLYEQERQFEMAGDLWCRLEQPDAASRAYRQAVAHSQAAGDPLAAARLLEMKLQAPAEAVAVLEAVPVESAKFGACCRELFALYGRLGQHEPAGQRIEQWARASVSGSVILPLTTALGVIAGEYPDRAVQARAADAARILIGGRLEHAEPFEVEQLLRIIARLAPQDRLLASDTSRYQERRRPRPPRRLPRRGSAARVVLSQEFLLEPPDVDWQTAVAAGELFYAAGIGPKGPVAVRGRWDGRQQSLQWDMPSLPRSLPLLLAASFRDRPVVQLALSTPLAHGGNLPIQRFVPTSDFPRATEVGCSSWLPAGLCALAYHLPRTIWAVRQESDSYLLCGYATDGTLLTTKELCTVYPSTQTGPLRRFSLVASEPVVAAGFNNLLWTLTEGDDQVKLGRAPALIQALTGPVAGGENPLVVTFEHGAGLLWLRDLTAAVQTTEVSSHWQLLAGDLAQPLPAFTYQGHLLLVGRAEGRVYSLGSGQPTESARFDPQPGETVAVLPTQADASFALLSRCGRMCTYRFLR